MRNVLGYFSREFIQIHTQRFERGQICYGCGDGTTQIKKLQMCTEIDPIWDTGITGIRGKIKISEFGGIVKNWNRSSKITAFQIKIKRIFKLKKPCIWE